MEINHPPEGMPSPEQQIAVLEKAFADAEHRAQKYQQERDRLNDQRWDLQQENRRLEQDYESLRLQKGGFGFKSLLAVAVASVFFGVICTWLFFRLKNDHAKAFGQFTRDHQFRFEYALSQGRFEEVEAAIRSNIDRPEVQAIRPEIEFTKKIVEAAKRGCGK